MRKFMLFVLLVVLSPLAFAFDDPYGLKEDERMQDEQRQRRVAIANAPIRQAEAVESLRDEVAALRKEIAELRLVLSQMIAKQ